MNYAAINDPFGTFDLARQTYLRYLDSPFRLRYEALLQERREMFDVDGRLYRHPLFEVISPYRSTGLTVEEACDRFGLDRDVADFIGRGLFPKSRHLFTHQLLSWEHCLRGDAVVVTTGTGSGKTECYLLPIFGYLANESRDWPAPPATQSLPFWRVPGQRRTSQRAYELGGRVPAVRALLLYPLNALVEDQLARIRRACNSSAAKMWLRRQRFNNRFWFGRYVGPTPVPGLPSSGTARNRQRNRLQEMDQDFREAVASARLRKVKRVLSHFQNPLSSEMWSRWDMQEVPPDILITNYSMLNIMLMRDVEQSIFDQTRLWLESDRKRNIFHLVVDEVHSYRGTPGTEVAYLLRSLLGRIGLSPDSKQLRIIATSASQGTETETRKHLSELFGCSPQRFAIIGGEKAPFPRPGSLDPIRAHKGELAILADASESTMKILEQLDRSPGTNGPTMGPGAKFVQQTSIPGLLESLSLVQPFTLSALSTEAFGDSFEDSMDASKGVLRAATMARDESGTALLQIRLHCFFHNAGRIWTCVNPQCHEPSAFAAQGEAPPVGRLFFEPRSMCPVCHSRVLELLYCQPCGETFLGGYKKAAEVPNAYYLSPDYPDLQRVPDRTLSLERTFGEYAVFWPARGRPLADGQTSRRWRWQEHTAYHYWEQGSLDRRLGRIAIGVRGVEPLHTPGFVFVGCSDGDNAFPSRCPHCAADWHWRRVPSPIRDLGSGFQQTTQVLNDSIMRELPPDVRKVVLYSDSRLDAAKLSTGIKLAHYRDVVRQIAFRAGLRASERAAEEHRRQLEDKAQAERLLDAERGLLAGTASPEIITERSRLIMSLGAKATEVLIYAARGGDVPDCLKMPVPPDQWVAIPFPRLMSDVRSSLLAIGMNPGGPGRTVRELRIHRPGGQQTIVKWEDVVNWDVNPRSYRSPLQPLDQQLVASVEASLKRALVEDVLFADGSRDCESLRIGFLWLKPTLPETFAENVAASVLRLLLQNRRWVGSEREGTNNTPGRVNKFIQRVEQVSGVQVRQSVVNLLSAHLHQWLVRVDDLLFICPSQMDDTIDAFVCPRCTRLHMHGSGGICTRCLQQLPAQATRSTFDPSRMDYYEFLARGEDDSFRLNSEELTGQTNDSDRLTRQRRFQDVFMATDIPIADAIDLLSVTTTMEAGIDIGELQAISLANMPPMRFNYQQRVGRAGRRGEYAMSTVLTMCRGRSHDEYYFERPKLMTSELPPPPYVDVDREQILTRVLNKEVLFRAFRGVPVPHSKDDVHGEFGDVQSWPTHRPTVADWIAKNFQEIEVIAAMLARQTAFDEAAETFRLASDVDRSLLHAIDAVASNPRVPGQQALSKQLAEEGLLPMFGFPTRVRSLYHQRPTLSHGALDQQSGIIDRPLDIAISQFAPTAQTVKDDQLLTAVGVVDYRFGGNTVHENPNPLGPPITVAVCRRCQALVTDPIGNAQCPYCLAAESPDGYRQVYLSEPPGFRTWFPIHPDFSGGFEFAPRALRARMGASSHAPRVKQNFAVDAIPQAQVFRINDNDGADFTFRKLLNSHSWVTEKGFDRAAEDLSVQERRAINSPQYDPNAAPDARALASISRTDVLTVTVPDVPRGLNLNPSVPEARAAWYSFGFMLRRAMAVRLDVSQAELDVGIQPIIDPRSPFFPPSARIFISDSLENGAGYSSYFANEHRFEELLEFMLDASDREKSFAGPLLAPQHADECLTSCYRCLREYGNMAFHPLLDWRLGLDMVRLALNPGNAIELSIEYWSRLVAATSPAYFSGLGLTDVSCDGFAIGESPVDGSWTIVTHPLWDRNRANLRLDVAIPYVRAELGGHQPQLKSIFRVVRFPYE